MRSECSLLVTLLVLLACPGSLRGFPTSPASPRAAGGGPDSTTGSGGQRFSQAHFQFTLDLYGALVNRSSQPNANVLFSPVGVAAVLSPLLQSPEAEVTQQIREVLRYSNMTSEEIQEGHSTMVANFDDAYYDQDLRLAYALFLQEGSASAESTRGLYPTGKTQEVNFHTNGTEIMHGINQWVARETEDLVGAPLADVPTAQVEALAVVVVYFSGRWLHRFERNLTFDKGLFYITLDERFEIPMMVGRLELPLGSSAELEVRILELPFVARRLSMFILLPDHPDHGLASLERNITSDNIKALFSTLKDEKVNLRLPRFRIDVIPPLQDALVSLGLTSVFPTTRDAQPSILIHDFLHRAVCEVVEAGEDSSPALTSKGDQVGTFGDKYFEVDHPFIFFVWDYIASSVLFMGRVVTPEPITLPPPN
ncbi:leukocyte elastase inhibitor-like [Panulirus ornatus]|uniref:leukocyte elastase inhibitor-like n=1 Tax=Panulirus ornatus TaxID=150431 RepID=UPI003A8C6189